LNPRRRLACAAGLSFLVDGLTGCGGDAVVPVGASIRHDDFLYTVLTAQPVGRIGDKVASGQFLVVYFEVANQAARVAHSWSNAIAYLVDASGRLYENDVTLQQALDQSGPFRWAAEYVTPPGTSEATMLVFDMPVDAPRPVDLMVRGELLMGDILDGVRFRRTRVRMP